MSFFAAVKAEALTAACSHLESARFFLMFDDAGVPNMPEVVQKVLNELLRAANEVFCVKVTAERFSFSQKDSDGKVLEIAHDFTPFNLAESLILKGGQKVKRDEIKLYFENLLALRLTDYGSTKIADFLGRGGDRMWEFVSKLVRDKTASGLYSGWNIVWQVADRTPRHLLELVATIFKKAGVTPNKRICVIPAAVQDEAVRDYSEMKLRHISFIPGKIELGARTKALGQHLSNITIAFGRICRESLQRGPMKTNSHRFHEMLAIEVDKYTNLVKWADYTMKMLIRYAIFDDTVTTTTYDGGLRKPIYILNRIYAPALQISVRRVVHWRLSSERLSRFLSDPSKEKVKRNGEDERDAHTQNEWI